MVRLFGTNGIREVVGDPLTPAFVTRVAGAIGGLLPVGAPIAVGRDGRTSSRAFARIVTATLALGGHRVIDLGLLPTPAIQYSVPRVGAQLGIIVTASHNPPEFNGVKCIAADGLEASREFEERVEAAVVQGAARAAPFDRVGEVTDDPLGAGRYLEGILAQVDVARIAARRPTLVLDCANGAGAVTTPPLLRRLGCRVVTINGQIDGTFPGHAPEPTEANLVDLRRTVAAVGADLGVAHDGDADRAVFVDARGRYVGGEEMLAVHGREAVRRHPGGVVVTAISTPRSVEEVVRAAGGTVTYTRVGSPAISHEMQRTHAVLGGEDNGGLIFPALHLARDGAMTLAATLDLLARSETTLVELLKDLPRYPVLKEKVDCPPSARDRVLAAVGAALTPGAERVVSLDGVKVFRDGGSVLVRPSGTEPLLRVVAEGRDEAGARALADRALAAIRTALTAPA